MEKIKEWFRNRWGRFVTTLGAILTALGTGIAALPDSANVWLPHVVNITGAKIASGLMLFFLFVASHMRHSQAAKVIAETKSDTKPNS